MKGILWKIQSPPYRCVFAFSLLLAIPITSTAKENGSAWKVGLARAVITPPEPVPLGGYASRKGFFKRVEQDIHAKALALEEAGGGRALLVTCELVGLNRYSIDLICRRIMEASGLPRDAIMMNFSQTHTAPAATLAMASRGHSTQEEADAIVGYTQWMADLLKKQRSGGFKNHHYHAPFAVWQFGSDLTLVGLPGEPVADYVRATQKILEKDHLWMAGYCNDFFGYLPNARILKEGGYEAQRGPALRTFAPGIEAVVTKKLRELAIAAGRPGIPERNWTPDRRDRSRQKEGSSKRSDMAE